LNFILKHKASDEGRAERYREHNTQGNTEKEDNPWIPNFLEGKPARIVLLIVGILFIIWLLAATIIIVPAGHKGVLLTMGKVEEMNLPEGLRIIAPWQNVVMMSVMIQKAEVTESTASNDLQEITTKLAVHYQINEALAWKVYQTMRTDYLHLLIEPVIMEELKATTADWTAEHLIIERPLVVIQLTETLDKRLQPFGIEILTVNIIDFQFSPEFWEAIERKVIASQDALAEKNKVEISRFQQLQNIINAEGQYNVTVIRANADAQQKIIAAQAEARRIFIEAEAQAEAIKIINLQVTPEYVNYLKWLRWNGELPDVLVTGADSDLLISIPAVP
jgi:regulator of protease activity HflC (stomatin/prohibitin superfamily)